MAGEYSGMEERQVLIRFRNGDSEAGNELFRRYRDRVFAMCANVTGNRDLAAEAVQEAFYRLLRIRNKIDPDKNFSAFLHKMAYNLCMDELRRKKNAVSWEDFSWVEEELPSVDELFAENEHKIEMKEVWQAVEKLPLSAKTLMELRYRSRLSPDEIANILELPASTVRVRLYRARKALAGMLMSLLREKK
ncbi:MAG: sigma-70 family RNA polymerase sigma factor [Planctomycetota bacterium]|nr:sigma-70 family RNA polymerase sigma factor [Planctomycetota bacterium]